MASETNAYTFGDPTPPSSSSSSSSSSRLRGWWLRPIVTMPAANDRSPTLKECAAFVAPICGAVFTVVAILSIFISIDKAHPHAKFSIQSVAVSPSDATWHVDFLVKNPSSRYSIYYDDGDASVRLGHLSVDVFKITRKRIYRDHTAFSLDFDAPGDGNDAVPGQLDIKLGGKHKRYVDYHEAGHFDIRCQNLTRSHGNIEKINSPTWQLLDVPLVASNDANSVFGKPGVCYLELFAHSVSVTASNANISTADWRIGLTAVSPVTGCKISLHAIKSRLLRGEDVIYESPPSLDIFGQLVTYDKTDGRVIDVDFEKVVMPGGIGGVVRDYRVEIAAGVKADSSHGFLMVLCGDLPVKFTADPTGNVIGSLLGNMKRCDYISRDNLNLSF